jgi:hypothetical protein
MQEPSSSLPSPPHSHYPSVSPRQTYTTLEPESNQSHHPITFDPEIVATPRPRRYLEPQNGTPSFAALSSPTRPVDLSVPASPDLDTIISNTIYTGKRKRDSSIGAGLGQRRQRLPTSTSVETHASSSSTNSMHSVQQQLTQMDPEDEDAVLGQYIHTDRLADPSHDCLQRLDGYTGEIFGSGEGFSQPLPLDIPQSQPTPNPTPLISQNSRGSQVTSWYAEASSSLQPPPPGQPRQSSPLFLQSQGLNDSGPDASHFDGPNATASPENTSHAWHRVSCDTPHAQKQSTNTLAKSKFRSGTLPPLKPRRQTSNNPAASQSPLTRCPLPTLSPSLEQQHPISSHGEESEEEEVSSQELDYPPLQTQAPYQSQS